MVNFEPVSRKRIAVPHPRPKDSRDSNWEDFLALRNIIDIPAVACVSEASGHTHFCRPRWSSGLPLVGLMVLPIYESIGERKDV